ncbi:MAG: hypothetical protein WEE66_01840 [Actinomycetota bacterium]
MNERLHAMDDEQLGTALASVELAWPSTPDVATIVGATIREHRAAPALVAPRLTLPSRRRTALIIAAALLALAGAALAARLVIDLGAIAVEVLPGRPTALPTNVATSSDLGREIPLAEAEKIAGFPAALPTALGPPDGAWLEEAEVGLESSDVAVRIVTHWFPFGHGDLPIIGGTKTGAVLMQFEGEWEVASKQLYAETNRFGVAIVDGHDAFWTTGEHELMLMAGGTIHRFLVTGNVLIWQDAGYTFRLETALPRKAAIAVAETVQPTIVSLGMVRAFAGMTAASAGDGCHYDTTEGRGTASR